MMDKNFIGLIVSVFNSNKANNFNTVELICFQSNEKAAKSFSQVSFEIVINKNHSLIEKNLQIYYQMPNILVLEEETNTKYKNIHENMAQIGSIT